MAQSKPRCPTIRNHEHSNRRDAQEKDLYYFYNILMDKHDEIVWGRKVNKDLVIKENNVLK